MAKHTISFSLDTETDRDIIEWLDKQRNRSRAIRDILRQAIAPASDTPTAALDLGAIRQVFEAVLEEHLAGIGAVGVDSREAGSEHRGGEDPSLAARLDSLEF